MKTPQPLIIHRNYTWKMFAPDGSVLGEYPSLNEAFKALEGNPGANVWNGETVYAIPNPDGIWTTEVRNGWKKP